MTYLCQEDHTTGCPSKAFACLSSIQQVLVNQLLAAGDQIKEQRTREQLWELVWQNDGLAQQGFRTLKPGNIIPFDIWLLCDNSSCENTR